MKLKGCYFLITDIFNKRAHSIQITKTVEALNDVGTDLSLVVPKYKKSYDLKKIFQYYNIKNKINIIFLFTFWFKSPNKTQIILFNLISILYLFYLKFFKKINFIYLRSELLYPLAFFGKYILNVDYFYELHREGKNLSQIKRKNLLIKNAKGVIVLTEKLKNRFLSLNKNIVVAHDAVDLSEFDIELSRGDARRKCNLSQTSNIALYVGSISSVKGVETIINNVKKLPEIDFYFIGQDIGDFSSNNSTKNLFFLGKKDHSEIPVYLKAADLLILPHPNNIQSQSPMKLFEYMASGTNILTSDLSNIREVVDEHEAIFFKSGDNEDYINKVKEFFSDKEKYLYLSSGAKIIIKNYTWNKRGEQIYNFIKNI